MSSLGSATVTPNVHVGSHARRANRIDLYRRSLDIVLSTTLLVVALPLIALMAIGSTISLRAWPFFSQYRVGRNGELFRFFKIRTLRPEVPGYTDKHHLDVSRIPAFCRMLRNLHLDELPQLLLVVTGKMSLVGPRPEMAYLHEQMPPAFASLRTAVRPGCTGMWQVSAACTELISAAPHYDRYYLAQRTLRLDLWILFRTALNMLGISRCVTLADVPSWTLRADGQDFVIVLPDASRVDAPSLALPATAAR
jgi:lipopolysaccharide/colanic/teichoic acid biosynthesis glycosyltransferase